MSQRCNNRSTGSSGEEDLPDLSDAMRECVRFIFCREGSKIPIKRFEISNHLATVCQTPGKLVNQVILGAQNLLKKVYGYKLVSHKVKSGVIYFVVLSEACESQPSAVEDMARRRMLMAALTHIFMSGGTVKEEEMWKFLEEAGLLEENDNAGRKVLTTTFTRQLYLTLTKEGEGDLARNNISWGPRAEIEVPKMFILEKMGKAFEKDPSHWCEQFKEASE